MGSLFLASCPCHDIIQFSPPVQKPHSFNPELKLGLITQVFHPTQPCPLLAPSTTNGETSPLPSYPSTQTIAGAMVLKEGIVCIDHRTTSSYPTPWTLSNPVDYQTLNHHYTLSLSEPQNPESCHSTNPVIFWISPQNSWTAFHQEPHGEPQPSTFRIS